MHARSDRDDAVSLVYQINPEGKTARQKPKSVVDVTTLSPARGHFNAGFTLSTYTHATEEMKRDAADAIGEVIAKAMYPNKANGTGQARPAPCRFVLPAPTAFRVRFRVNA